MNCGHNDTDDYHKTYPDGRSGWMCRCKKCGHIFFEVI